MQSLEQTLSKVTSLGAVAEDRRGELTGIAHHDHGQWIVLEGDERGRLHGLRGLVNNHCVELEA
jgi:hypothetical protein